MVEKITVFMTRDDSTFETEAEALAHEHWSKYRDAWIAFIEGLPEGEVPRDDIPLDLIRIIYDHAADVAPLLALARGTGVPEAPEAPATAPASDPVPPPPAVPAPAVLPPPPPPPVADPPPPSGGYRMKNTT